MMRIWITRNGCDSDKWVDMMRQGRLPARTSTLMAPR
jgi:hypothetical protein